MSKLIPRRTIDAVRNYVDIALDIAGIDCTLYIPTDTSYDTANKLDVWSEVPEDFVYLSYSAKVFIDWHPDTRKLKGLGLFVEGGIPILARLGNKATPLEGSGAGVEVEVDIPMKSYFRIAPEFIPEDFAGVEDYEIVDQSIDKFHDAVITKTYLIAPRRIEQ